MILVQFEASVVTMRWFFHPPLRQVGLVDQRYGGNRSSAGYVASNTLARAYNL